MHSDDEKGKKSTQTRRDFIKTLSGTLAGALLFNRCDPGGGESDSQPDEPKPSVLGPRVGTANPYVTEGGRPILVCVEGSDFNAMLRAGLDAIGGLGKLVKDNQDVLIKPNLFEQSQYPWVSSPESIVGIIKEVKKVTSGLVNVGDESFEKTNLVYEHLSLWPIINEAGGILSNFLNTHKVRRSTWDSEKPDFLVFRDVYDAPVLISTPVLKRHYLSSLTCAIKNNVGTIRGSNASSTRGYMHYQSPNFMAELAEVAGLANPDLNIVDARSIVTEIGPFHEQGGPVVQLNKVIICGDIVATDAYCAKLMEENDSSFSASSIQATLSRAVGLGMGTSNLDDVDIMEIST